MFFRRFWLMLSFFSAVSGLKSQCTISAKREACVNDIVTFNLNTSGTVSGYSWDFGGYGTSSNTSPLMKFTATGTVVVVCTVTYSGGQTCKDTHSIVIHPNPKAAASIAKESFYCLNGNKVCFNDSNQKAVRGIYSISILWGDGNLDKYSSPIPKKWCHSYTDTGTYKFEMEIADSIGCKDKFSLNVRIKPSVKSVYSSSEMQICDSVKACLKDVSQGSGLKSVWYDGFGLKISDSAAFCKMLGPGTQAVYKLITQNAEGCADTTTYQYTVSKSPFYLKNLDSLVCINELYGGKLLFIAGEEVQWKLNGLSEYIDTKYVGYDNARIGMNYITAQRIGGCKGTLKDSFRVIGVRAIGRLYNFNRRRVEDTVFMIDLTKAPAGTRITRLWDFGDVNAPRCTTWTAMGQNVGKNCNFSRDSIARHFYSDTNCFAPRLIIMDSVTNCFDDTLMPVYRKNACPKVNMPGKVCLGDYAGFSMPGNMYNKVKNKNFLIVDTVKGSDTIVLYGGYGQYLYKTLGFKSPVLWRFYDPDTVWTERNGKIEVWFIRNGDGWVGDTFLNEVFVVEKSNSEFTVTKISECNPFKGRLTFKDSIWRFPGKLQIDWGDTVITYTGWTDSVTKLQPIDHIYKTGGFYQIKVTMFPSKGCHSTSFGNLAFSHAANFGLKAKCWNENVCFLDSVIDVKTGTRWNKNNGFGKLFWNFGDGKTDTGYGVCHYYGTPGTYKVVLTAISVKGCTAVAEKTFILAKPHALIKHQPTIYCSDIRQYFDSSEILFPDGSQKITQWKWNFADGTQPVYVKNPAHIFPGGGVYPVKLTITTSLGCKDSVTKVFTVIGPQVEAAIVSDSMGCAPLTVEFGNLSKQTKSFIWEFGDKLNTFYSTDKDTNTRFTYRDAGVYYVHITGGDSFYNPTTGSKYYCSVRYPGPGQKPLRITVYESAYTSFNLPEFICLKDSFTIENTSPNRQLKYVWNMGNADTFHRNNDTFRYRYVKAGKYQVVLKPAITSFTACSDTTVKEINVVEVKPSFKEDCSNTRGTELVLKNTTGIDFSGFQWTLLDPRDSSEKVLSTNTNFYYNFGKDTGYKIICLGINGGKSCGGKVCETILVQGDISFANVFTPDESPGFNDTYRVPLYGYADFEIRIFNRWGERIYHSFNAREEWNGRVNNVGPQLPTGTYFYQIWYRPECSDKQIEVHGSINLIR